MFIKKKLNDNDLLAKYIFNIKSDLRADGKPRPNILKPRDGEKLSTFEVTGLSHEVICSHGHIYVDNTSKNRVHCGYIKFKHESFLRIGLETIYDNKPPRHVSIKFPDEPEKRRELAKALSEEVLISNNQTEKKYFAGCE
jgi:hypothetical protein